MRGQCSGSTLSTTNHTLSVRMNHTYPIDTHWHFDQVHFGHICRHLRCLLRQSITAYCMGKPKREKNNVWSTIYNPISKDIEQSWHKEVFVSFPSSTACATGVFGAGCNSPCLCQNGAQCNHITGACTCTAGWQGSTCAAGRELYIRHSVMLHCTALAGTCMQIPVCLHDSTSVCKQNACASTHVQWQHERSVQSVAFQLLDCWVLAW